MTSCEEREKQRIIDASKALYLASQSVRVLTHLTWGPEVRENFLKNKARKLPQGVEYQAFDSSIVSDLTKEARREIKKLRDGAVKQWLVRTAERLEISAQMLENCGSLEFFRCSRELFGAPADELVEGFGTSLSLAGRLTDLFNSAETLDLGAPPEACHLADAVADRMRSFTKVFGEFAPEIEIVDELSANVLAGAKRIRVRRTACFTDLDIQQLAHHEVMVHVATSLNGYLQENLPLLGASHPGTTKTQEGLAVFAELITGSIDLDRFRRLADRVQAIQMSIDGADFIEVYRFFLDQIGQGEQAFENARRVFRGGLLKGSGPFTKDVVYLDGLLRVHNFLRVAVSSGRSDCLPLLFVGKLDIEDLPAISQLSADGLCEPPRFLPNWMKDLRFLVSYLGYSAFLNTVDLQSVRSHFAELLQSIPSLGSIMRQK